MELTPPEEHADVQCIIQRWIDSSISKTVNAPPKGFTVEEVERVYMRLYHGKQKAEQFMLTVARFTSSNLKERNSTSKTS